MAANSKLQNDLTQGSVWRQLVRFALPLMLTGFLQTLYGVVDTIVAGREVGSQGISAVVNANFALLIVSYIAIGLSTGGNVLLSRLYGAKDHEGRMQASGTLLTFSMLVGLVCAVLVAALRWPIIDLLNVPAREAAGEYMLICSIGVVFTFGYNAMSAMIRSAGNSRAPLWFIIVAAATNIVLDIWFVVGLGMGVAGTAWATIIAQGMTFFAALIYVLRNRGFYGLALKNLRVRWDKLKTILKLGVPSVINMMMGGISWMVVTAFINKYGLDYSAAAGAVNKTRELCLITLSSLANGTATMVAQNLGAGLEERALRVVKVSLIFSLCAAAVLTALTELFAEPLASIFITDPAALKISVEHMHIEMLCLTSFAAFMSLNAMATGSGHMLFVLFNTILQSIVSRVVLVLILEHFFGYRGVYWACAFATVISIPAGALFIRSNRWRRSTI